MLVAIKAVSAVIRLALREQHAEPLTGKIIVVCRCVLMVVTRKRVKRATVIMTARKDLSVRLRVEVGPVPEPALEIQIVVKSKSAQRSRGRVWIRSAYVWIVALLDWVKFAKTNPVKRGRPVFTTMEPDVAFRIAKPAQIVAVV